MKLRRSKSMRLPKKPSQENVISTTTSNGIPLLMASDPLLPSTPVLLSQPNLSFMETEVGVQPTKKNKRKSAEDFSMSEVIEIKKRREVEEVDTMEVVVENGAKFVCPHCTHTISSDCGDCVANETIISHMASHRTEYYQCAICNHFGSNESNILDHILRTHPNDKLKFYHNPPTMNRNIYIELSKTTLDCNSCGSDFEKVAQAVEHSKLDHNNECIDLTAVLMTKRTDVNLKTQHSTKETWLVRALLMCMVCGQQEMQMNEMIVHHRDAHAFQPLSLKWSDTLVTVPKDQEQMMKKPMESLIYCCVHCQDENPFSALYNSPEEVYNHWNAMHTTESNSKPFQFYATEPIRCYHCNVISTFTGLKSHCIVEHPGKPIVFLNHLNQKQCGICPYTGGSMVQHFETEHKLILQTDIFSPICLSDECVNKLNAIDVHTKFKCCPCSEVFETDRDLRTHHAHMHPTIECNNQTRFIDRNVMVYVDCCQMELMPINYLNHFLYHIMNFTCPNCNFTATTLSDILCHDLHVHKEIDVAGQRFALYYDLALMHHLRTKIFFGNGLVLVNHNLLHTKFDDSRKCKTLLDKMIDSEKDKFQKMSNCSEL